MHAFPQQGTRIHIYEFDNRLLHNREEILAAANGEMLSIPQSNSRWTDKFKPGLDVFAGYQDDQKLEDNVAFYLGPLVEFAKQVLKDKEDDWHNFPIYLKATGGLRTLPTPDRVRLINAVRKLFRNETFNPFSFEDERARVISGEEEGAYGWAAVNFIKGTLVEQTLGAGTVLNPSKYNTNANTLFACFLQRLLHVETHSPRLLRDIDVRDDIWHGGNGWRFDPNWILRE